MFDLDLFLLLPGVTGSMGGRSGHLSAIGDDNNKQHPDDGQTHGQTAMGIDLVLISSA